MRIFFWAEERGAGSEERGISWLSVFWTLSYWTDVDVSDGRPSQTRGYGSEPTHLLLFEVLDQSHLCTACWYNSESKAWLAAVIKLSKKKKKERSTAGFFIGTEQTITQLDSKQCRWDTTKVYKGSHTLGCTPPASSIKVSENRLDTQTDTKKPKKKGRRKASVFISVASLCAAKESNFKCEAYVIRQGRLKVNHRQLWANKQTGTYSTLCISVSALMHSIFAYFFPPPLPLIVLYI